MNNQRSKDERYTKKFQDQMNGILKSKLVGNEKLIQCLDDKSFNGEFYNPAWAVSDRGRVWSISNEKWLVPFGDGKTKKYWKGKNSRIEKNIKISRLVANYFCEKPNAELYDEKDLDVHHINAERCHMPHENLTQQEKIMLCMDANNAMNLCWVTRADHIGDVTKYERIAQRDQDNPIRREMEHYAMRYTDSGEKTLTVVQSLRNAEGVDDYYKELYADRLRECGEMIEE